MSQQVLSDQVPARQVLSPEVRLDRFEEWLISRKARELADMAGFHHGDIEDIEQEIRFGVLQRLPQFDPRKAGRHTFVAMIVRYQALAMLKHRRAGKRNGGKWLKSLNTLVPDEDGNSVAISAARHAANGRRAGQMCNVEICP